MPQIICDCRCTYFKSRECELGLELVPVRNQAASCPLALKAARRQRGTDLLFN